MAAVYWILWVAALFSGALYLAAAIRRFRLPSQFDVDQCAKCGYPKAPAASQCPECGQSYAVRGAPKHARRAILIGLLLVAFPIGIAFTLRQYVGNLERCLPNSVLFVLAEHFSSEPALEELDERVAVGHARLPAWLAPPPGQRAYARLCARILGPPLPRYDEAVLAYEGLCASVSDDQAVAEVLDSFLDSDSAEVRLSIVALLEAMHASAPTRWEGVVSAERRKQLLEDPSLGVRLHAARMLWDIDQDSRATTVFEKALQTTEGRESVLFRLIYPTTLRNLDGKLGPAIAKALHGNRYQDRGLQAMQNLSYISDETLRELVRIEWEDDRAMAAYHRVLVKAGPRAEIEMDRLRERLDHDNPQVSGTAALALGAIGAGASEAIPRLERMVRDGHSYFGKYWALTALEQIAGDAALPLALDELEKIANERETTMALLWMQDAALEIVAKHARPGDRRACEAVQRVLARAESQRVRNKIRAVLDQLCQ